MSASAFVSRASFAPCVLSRVRPSLSSAAFSLCSAALRCSSSLTFAASVSSRRACFCWASVASRRARCSLLRSSVSARKSSLSCALRSLCCFRSSFSPATRDSSDAIFACCRRIVISEETRDFLSTFSATFRSCSSGFRSAPLSSGWSCASELLQRGFLFSSFEAVLSKFQRNRKSII